VLNPPIITEQRILLTDVEDARFVPTLINGESSFISLSFPCTLFDSRFYRTSEIQQLRNSLVLLCADNTRKLAVVLYNNQNDITGLAEFNYPTEDPRLYHRVFLGQDEFFIFVEVRATEINVDLATRDFRSINPDRRARLVQAS
jgi:hypothetical protein